MKRRSFVKSALGGLAVASSRSNLFGQSAPSNRVRVAVMGCHARGRGFELAKTLATIPIAEVAVVCDVDSRARDAAAAEIEKITSKAPQKALDIRKVVEDKNIDAILCAAPDHWHAPAALMTIKAGKAVYVEKPVSFCPAEGEILVQAANSNKTTFQMGTQRRSSTVYQQIIKEIHNGVIGTPRFARCWYATRRAPIGKGKEVPVPEWLDWNLWQGPAPRQPYRDNLVHYNWHWLRHWGTGEAGNNATHYVDIARWALNATYPTRTTCGGGRLFHENDDWEWFDTQSATFEFDNRTFMTWEGLTSVNGRPYEGFSTGCMIYGLKGSILFAPNNTCTHFDNKGKEIKRWTAKDIVDDATNRTNPTMGLDVLHLTNFLECIRNKSTETAAPVEMAHASSLLPHLANIAHLTGETIHLDAKSGKLTPSSPGANLWAREYEKGWEMKL